MVSFTAGISAETTVTGYVGESVQIRCSYNSRYETYIKYLCRGKCSALLGTKDIPVQSGSAKDQRFSLDDDTAARVFTINITDLRPEDGGTYWCGIKRPIPRPDIYTKILLLVKTVQAQSTPLSSFPSTGIIILYVFVSLLVSGIALGVLVLLWKWRKFQVTLADVQSTVTAQRNARRDWDTPDHEYDVPVRSGPAFWKFLSSSRCCDIKEACLDMVCLMMSLRAALLRLTLIPLSVILDKERWVGTPGVQLRVTELHVEALEEVTEGETADLTCKTTCSLTDPTFIWYKDGRPLTTKTIKNNQLHLQTVSSEDAGSYSCAVRGSQHLHSTAHSLRVRYPPKNVSVSISPSGEIVEGSSVTLTCSSDGNPPVKIYTWFKGSTSVGEGKTYSIPNIRSEDSGEYTCQSWNDHGERNSTAVNLNVFYPPKSVSVSISPSGEIVEGSSVTLTCSSDGNPPVKNYTWFKEGGTSPVGSGHSYSPLQSGSYYCEAQNEHGAQNATAVSVIVKGFPSAVIYAVAGVGCGVIILGVISIFLIRNKRRAKKNEDLLVDTVYSEIWARSATTDAALNRSASQEHVYANVSPSRPEENSKAESSPVVAFVCMAAVEVEIKEESQEDEVQYSSIRFHHCSPPNRYEGESVDNPSAIYSTVKRKTH
ncbi:hypothetical protein MHYP_G00101670 [Metynnis hypsauchen]